MKSLRQLKKLSQNMYVFSNEASAADFDAVPNHEKIEALETIVMLQV